MEFGCSNLRISCRRSAFRRHPSYDAKKDSTRRHASSFVREPRGSGFDQKSKLPQSVSGLYWSLTFLSCSCLIPRNGFHLTRSRSIPGFSNIAQKMTGALNGARVRQRTAKHDVHMHRKGFWCFVFGLIFVCFHGVRYMVLNGPLGFHSSYKSSQN